MAEVIATQPEEGMILLDRFKILKLFKTGGFGSLYLAADIKTDKKVIVKFNKKY